MKVQLNNIEARTSGKCWMMFSEESSEMLITLRGGITVRKSITKSFSSGAYSEEENAVQMCTKIGERQPPG